MSANKLVKIVSADSLLKKKGNTPVEPKKYQNNGSNISIRHMADGRTIVAAKRVF